MSFQDITRLDSRRKVHSVLSKLSRAFGTKGPVRCESLIPSAGIGEKKHKKAGLQPTACHKHAMFWVRTAEVSPAKRYHRPRFTPFFEVKKHGDVFEAKPKKACHMGQALLAEFSLMCICIYIYAASYLHNQYTFIDLWYAMYLFIWYGYNMNSWRCVYLIFVFFW